MIRTVTFDAANTLIRLTAPPGQTYAAVARRFGATPDPVRLNDAFLLAWKETPPLPDEFGPRADDGRSWWRNLVQATLTRADCSVNSFPEYFDAVYQEFTRPGIWQLMPGVTDLLSALAQSGIRLGVVSNFDRRLYLILRNLEVLDRFEHIVVSSEVGTDKPSPRIFEEVLRRFQISAKEALHVGDEDEADGVGPRAVGMFAFVLGKDGNLNELFWTISRLARRDLSAG
jgi:putative hydrolase of the HAD superfamily